MVVTATAPPRLDGGPAGYAAAVRNELGLSDGAPCTGLPDLVRRRLPWVELRFAPLAAPEGRQDALLCPRAHGGFLIVVDPRPSPRDPSLGDPAEMTLLACLGLRVAVEALIGAGVGFVVWLALYIAAIRHEAKERQDG